MMSKSFGASLSFDEIRAIERDVIAEAQAGRNQAAWQKLQPLRNAQSQQPEAAIALLMIVNAQCLEKEAAVDLLSEVAESHDQNVGVLSALGQCLEAVRDIDDLSAPPPDNSIFHTVLEKLEAFATAS